MCVVEHSLSSGSQWGQFWGHLGMSGNSFDCHNCGGGGTGILWEAARVAAKHLTMHKAAPQQTIIQPKMSMVPRLRDLVLE